MARSTVVVPSVIAGGLALLVACAAPAPERAGPAPTAVRPAPAAELGRAEGAPEPLPNLHRLTDDVLSGGVPGGDAGFAALAALGVRTVISVDGATPDVAGAAARGLRYVHIPITYAEVSEAQTLELARALRDLPGPVYLHCHHGKHRSPAAAAAAAVALGLVSAERGVDFLREAGTAPSYEGLYACVAAATPVSQAALDLAPADFPAAREAEGIVAAMIEVDLAFEHLVTVRGAGWTVPPEHPDLVPAAEAGRLADNLRLSGEDPDVAALGEGFARRLAASVDEASALEAAIVRGAPRAELDALYARVRVSCKDCHAAHRDRR